MSAPGMRLCRELDILAAHAIINRLITVHPAPGEIYAAGARAELLDKRTGYGRVIITAGRPRRMAMAHRIIWIAAHGIPTWDTLITHINGRRYDNRLANLHARTEAGDVRPGQLMPYPTPLTATPPTPRETPT